MKPCDCLNHCGDDPALKTNKAEPCFERSLKGQLINGLELQRRVMLDNAALLQQYFPEGRLHTEFMLREKIIALLVERIKESSPQQPQTTEH